MAITWLVIDYETWYTGTQYHPNVKTSLLPTRAKAKELQCGTLLIYETADMKQLILVLCNVVQFRLCSCCLGFPS